MPAVAEPKTPGADTMTEAETVALAIPVGVALSTFEDPRDALLAVFAFGMAVGVEDTDKANRLINGAEALLVQSPDYENFLTVTALVTGELAGPE